MTQRPKPQRKSPAARVAHHRRTTAGHASQDTPALRLQKFMADCGVAARRKCEEMIAAGRVRVNGTVVTRLGTTIRVGRDAVELDGKPLSAAPAAETPHLYLLLNKPRGYLVTASDERGRRTVFDLIGPQPRRIFAVGRLDKESEGLLLLTSDGDLAQSLAHPSFETEKEYEVTAEGAVGRDTCRRLQEGVDLDNRRTMPALVRIVRRDAETSVLTVAIREGRKRQVRRMLDAVGHPVIRLIRVREGGLRLGDLPTGRWRNLEPGEVAALKAEKGKTR